MIDDKVPAFIKKFFWDINPDKLNINKDYFIILERLLNYADDKSLKWTLNIYSYEKIKEVLINSRRLTEKTANFWQKHLNIERNEMQCFQKPYLKMEKKF
jgi:hypothetical protein